MKSLIYVGLASLLVGCASPPQANIPSPTTSPIATMYDYTIATPQGEPLSISQLAQALQQADIVLVGEWHSLPCCPPFTSSINGGTLPTKPTFNVIDGTIYPR